MRTSPPCRANQRRLDARLPLTTHFFMARGISCDIRLRSYLYQQALIQFKTITGHHFFWFSCRLKYSLYFQRLAKNSWWDSHLTEGERGLVSPFLACGGHHGPQQCPFSLTEDNKTDKGMQLLGHLHLVRHQRWVKLDPKHRTSKCFQPNAALLRAVKRQSCLPDSAGC